MANEHLFFVVYRGKDGGEWRGYGKPLTSKRLAENQVELAADPQLEFAVFTGVRLSPETEAEVEARLGAF
jgi:hypothetical protein